METIDRKQFNFGVLDYSKTFDNHASRLKRYREAYSHMGEAQGDLRYDFTLDQDAAYKRELNESQYAAQVLRRFWFNEKSTRLNVKSRVNWYFREQIGSYLNNAELPKSWATAVYLDCYDELNEFMEVVAQVVWVRLKK